jgi:phosphoglycolate phosphatase-like HAD superfamily hydrolase
VVGDTSRVSLVCCDLVGIVIDNSVVERAFAEAIAAQGLVAGTQSYTRAMVMFDRSRGRPPQDIMHDVFDGDAARSGVASMSFDQSFRAAAERFGVVTPESFRAALGQLAAAGVKLCLLTSLSRGATGPLADRLRREGLGDLVLCGDDAPRRFPWPDLVLTAILRLGAGDVRDVAVIGATDSCVESGRRAGAGLIVGLADGPRRAEALQKAGATHILTSLAELHALVAPAA